MHITANRESFRQSFANCKAAIPTKPPKPILSNVKLSAGKFTTLSATDTEIGITTEIECECREPGNALLPHTRVYDILSAATSEHVDIRLDGESVTLTCGRSKFSIPTEPPNEFPSPRVFDATDYFQFQSDALRRAIRRAKISCDIGDTRYALGGVFFDLQSGASTLVATDTKRMSVCPVATAAIGSPSDIEGVVPERAAVLIERLLPQDASLAMLSMDKASILVQSGKTSFYSRLSEGRFPRYRKAIPQNNNVIANVVNGPFREALIQADILKGEDTNVVKFAFEDGLLTMNSQGSGVGQSVVQVPISFDYSPIFAGFNPSLISEMCGLFSPETPIEISLKDGDNPIVIRVEDLTYVVVPFGIPDAPKKSRD